MKNYKICISRYLNESKNIEPEDQWYCKRSSDTLSCMYFKTRELQVGFFKKNPIERAAADDDDDVSGQ